MNSANLKKKKISEYQIEDIKEIFLEILKKISSKIILIELGSDFLNIGLAKSQNNRLYLKKIFRQTLPKEALDKSLPSDPVNFGIYLKQLIDENKISTNRVALLLPSDACYTRLIDIPEEINEDDAIEFIENPDSDLQIPISLENSDFEVKLTSLPKKEVRNKYFNKYFLTSIPKKNVNVILNSIKSANLEICSIQMSHMCIANLLKKEINNINENELIISVDLLDEFSQIVIFDNSGPLLIKRLASIRKYPSIEDLKIINEDKLKQNKNSKNKRKPQNYHPLSKLDLKVLLREISVTYSDFLRDNDLNKKGKIFLSGRNSQHKNLVEIIGNNLNMDVAVISPINNYFLKEFVYDPDKINQFSMARLIGLGLSLIKSDESENESFNNEFMFKSFSIKDDIKSDDNKNLNTTKLLKQEKKTKLEDKKKDLPPLPNIKKEKNSSIKKDASGNETKSNKKDDKPEVNKNKTFKMDTSFLKND